MLGHLYWWLVGGYDLEIGHVEVATKVVTLWKVAFLCAVMREQMCNIGDASENHDFVPRIKQMQLSWFISPVALYRPNLKISNTALSSA